MIDQPKITSDSIKPEPVWRGRKKAVAVIVTIVFCWAAYAWPSLAFPLLFPVIMLWNWAIWPPGVSYRVSNPWDIEAIGKVVGNAMKKERERSHREDERRYRQDL